MNGTASEHWILALETSTDWASLALLHGHGLHAERLWPARRTLAQGLVLQAQELLGQASVLPAALALIAVSRGPGSFTSTRIGVVTGKGWAQALRLPIVGVAALDALAWGTPCQGVRTCAAVLPAPRRGVYLGLYEVGEEAPCRRGPLRLLSPDEAIEMVRAQPGPGVLTGGAGEPLTPWLQALGSNWRWAGPSFSLPRAAWVGDLAWQRWQRGACDDLYSLAPLYLGPTEAERNLGQVVYAPPT